MEPTGHYNGPHKVERASQMLDNLLLRLFPHKWTGSCAYIWLMTFDTHERRVEIRYSADEGQIDNAWLSIQAIAEVNGVVIREVLSDLQRRRVLVIRYRVGG